MERKSGKNIFESLWNIVVDLETGHTSEKALKHPAATGNGLIQWASAWRATHQSIYKKQLWNWFGMPIYLKQIIEQGISSSG